MALVQLPVFTHDYERDALQRPVSADGAPVGLQISKFHALRGSPAPRGPSVFCQQGPPAPGTHAGAPLPTNMSVSNSDDEIATFKVTLGPGVTA